MELSDGTYELVGPKIRGNPYGLSGHHLLHHGCTKIHVAAITFDGIRSYLEANPTMEGIVWHHPDSRMVKIKRRDFGFKWPPSREKQHEMD